MSQKSKALGIADTVAELPPISIYGDLAGTITSIPSSMLSLAVRVGKLGNGQSVLVPMTEFRVVMAADGGDEHDEEAEEVAAVIPFENAAYLIADLASDMARACQELTSFAGGTLPLERTRIQHAVGYLRDAETELARCVAELTGLLGD